MYTSLAGTFIPGFLFAFAITTIDSSIVAILNSLTPFNTLILGAMFFGFAFNRTQFYGIIIGLVGTLLVNFRKFFFKSQSELLVCFINNYSFY